MIRLKHTESGQEADLISRQGSTANLLIDGQSITADITAFEPISGAPDGITVSSRRSPCSACIIGDLCKNNPVCEACAARLQYVARTAGMGSKTMTQIYHGNAPAEFLRYAGFMR